MGNNQKRNFALDTIAVHAGQTPDPVTGAIIPPVYATSTYEQQAPGVNTGYKYSRYQNLSRENCEAAIAALENGRCGFAFGSGLAAIAAVLDTLKPGDKILSVDDLYGGTYSLFSLLREKSSGLKFQYMDFSNLQKVSQAITPDVKLIWVETPTNPLLKIIDLQKIISIAHRKKVLVCVDNTFATPCLQRPLEMGADLVVHSLTKYINGHSDVVGGAVVTKENNALARRLRFIQGAAGAVPSPFDCFLINRGIKTLGLRMERHCDNAEAVAAALSKNRNVSQVVYPGLKSHPQHALAKRQMRRYGGMVSFYIKGGMPAAKKFFKRLEIISLAVSLGGVESLICHPGTMTHESIPRAERERLGITDGLVRLSVGIENVDDLVRDLNQALKF